VTNDTFAALRSLGGRKKPDQTPRVGRSSRWTSASMRSRSGIAAPSGGRWALVRDLVVEDASPTERAHAWAATLLERHGLVARETAAIEGQRGGFSAIYRVLRGMEEAGKVRRGYFIEGLGGAQFAWPGVIDRLRRVRDDDTEGGVVVLSAIDPANPYGWLLPWPEYRDEGARGPRRIAGAAVILVDGEPVLYLDRNGRRLRSMADAPGEAVARAVSRLLEVARRRPRRTLLIDVVDGEQATASALAPALRAAGFSREYLSLRLYAR